MHAIRNSRYMKTLAIALLGASFGLASTGYAQTQNNTYFTSQSFSDSGQSVQTLLGLLQSPLKWGPDDQSETNGSGSNTQIANSISESQSGVFVYQSTNDTNSTDAGASGDNQANASSSSGYGSALGGLISWSSLAIQLTCLQDSNVTYQIDCTTYETISGFSINGQPVPAGSFNPGTSYPVTGNIPDTNCPLGVDSFSGTVVLDNSILNSGTEQGSDTENAMLITGTATCKTAGLLTLYTTDYSEQIGGPYVTYDDEDDESEYIVTRYVNKLGL